MSQYEFLLKRRQIVKVDPDPKVAITKLRAAKRHLRAAQKLMSKAGGEEEMPEKAFEDAYSAGRTAIDALMTLEGYEVHPEARDKHVVILSFGRLVLGREGEKWVNAVRGMRQKRHDIEYGLREIEVLPTVASKRIKSVQELVDFVEERITGQISMEL